MPSSARQGVKQVLLGIGTENGIAINQVATNSRSPHHETQHEEDSAYPSSSRGHRGFM